MKRVLAVFCLGVVVAACGGDDAPDVECGNATVETGEQCDDGNTTAGDGCSATCQTETGPACGDGTIDTGEECDDGNTTAGDGCSATCQNEAGPACGDGTVDAGEECDDGNTTAGDGCSATCTTEVGPACGDGTVDVGEECDDGNTANGDGCSATCTTEAACGDGTLDIGEECDDGNTTNGDGCTDCVLDVCGDGTINDAGAEECDDANMTDGDGCTDCVLDVCGDGTINDAGAEECDDANMTDGDGCTACVIDVCGDGIVNNAGMEVCDDGNTASGDGCNAACAQETGFTCVGTPSVCTTTCGDSIVVGAESCDDGNTTSGDCCSATCGLEAGCEIEPNNDLLTANDFAALAVADELKAFISPAGDHDWFLFVVPAGGAATYALHAESLDGPLGSLCAMNQVDTFFTVTDSAGVSLTTDDDGGDGFCSMIDMALAPGTYYLDVRAFSAGMVLNYTLFLTLTPIVCGDGITSVGEVCDDGNLVSGDGCDTNCTVTACGNGVTSGTEACDDGNLTDDDGCDSNCTFTACGNGVLTTGEACDDGNLAAFDGCSATCTLETFCGNGVLDGFETCDDGNLASGDGCSFPTCQVEPGHFFESEPNGTSAEADFAGTPEVIIHAGIGPVADVDFFSFTVPSYADVRIETFDNDPALATCVATIDTVIELRAPDGTTILITDDQDGINNCSLINSTIDAAARRLAPGTYYVRVQDFGNDTAIPAYQLQISFNALCGDGLTSGSEECDGGATCDATCARIPVCGDGLIDSPETCDDGNTASGDGCSAACLLELTAEVEPNNGPAQADINVVQLTGDAIVSGSIGVVADIDTYRLVVGTAGVIRFETFDATNGSCVGMTTTLRLLNSGGTQIYADNLSGISSCSALVANVPAGIFYIQVEETGNNALIASYLLDVEYQGNAGSETEPNDVQATATPLGGIDVFMLGARFNLPGPAAPTDDWYAITVPSGGSIRAEVIEGGAETCEANNVDSRLTLFDAGGAQLVDDDDDGRGFCSQIDGTGSVGFKDAGAHNLAAGTYYLRVSGSTFCTGGMTAACEFDYRLQVTVRSP